MGYTPEQIAEAVAALEKQEAKDAERKAKAEERAAQLAQDAALLTTVGIDESLVATLVENNEVSVSDYGTSTWTGFVLGAVPFDDLGVSVKITVTVTDPDMFPEIKETLAVRKVEADLARAAARKAKKVEAAKALLAAEALRNSA